MKVYGETTREHYDEPLFPFSVGVPSPVSGERGESLSLTKRRRPSFWLRVFCQGLVHNRSTSRSGLGSGTGGLDHQKTVGNEGRSPGVYTPVLPLFTVIQSRTSTPLRPQSFTRSEGTRRGHENLRSLVGSRLDTPGQGSRW